MSETTGKIKVIYDTQFVSDNFSKREFVITMGDTYPQHVMFQATQAKCSLLDNLKVGDEVKVNYNLRGREWNGPQGIKYFNTLEAWKIENLTQNEGEDSKTTFTPNNNPNDDLPF